MSTKTSKRQRRLSDLSTSPLSTQDVAFPKLLPRGRANCDIEVDDDEIESDTDDEHVDSRGEFLRQRRAFHKIQGRAKSKRGAWSTKLVNREFEEWKLFCLQMKREDESPPVHRWDPVNALKSCEAETFKTYVESRVRFNNVKKETTIKAYWRRLLCAYIDVTGYGMKNGVELDMRDWIPTYLTPTYKLDTSEKEKHAMYVLDLYTILRALWTMDAKPRHGRFRAQIDTILVLAGATATRPQALIESSSAKGSNKALSYEHITILRVRDKKNRNRTTTVVLVNLVHIKNSGGKGRRKRFVFRIENMPAFCIVSRLISFAIADNAFRRQYTSPEEIFALKISPQKDSLQVRFREEMLCRPIFRDIKNVASGSIVSATKALPYSKCRDHFVWLGRVAGFEQPLELYQLRRASGRKMNSALTTEERNQAMGHHGDTYQQFYLPDLIEEDFQSIYFGTPSQDELIQHAARMGISRDERAPIDLTNEQKLAFKLELDKDPRVLRFRKQRERNKQKIQSQGYYPIETAKGTSLYEHYIEAKRKLHSLTNVLRKRKKDQAILDFHNTIDDYDIETQLDDTVSSKLPTRSSVKYEFPERAVIANLLSRPLNELPEEKARRLRMEFVCNLVSYCSRMESRQDELSSVTLRVQSPIERCHPQSRKRKADDNEFNPELQVQRPTQEVRSALVTQEGARLIWTPTQTEEMQVTMGIQMKFTDLVCLLCIGAGKLHQFKKKESLGKHIDCHKAEGVFKQGFQCQHPSCSDWIEGEGSFKQHAALKHGVCHPVPRSR